MIKCHSPVLYIHLMHLYLFGVLRRFQHCTGHITTDNWEGRGNQYIQLVKVLYCKLPTNGKQLPAFPLKVVPGTEPRSQRWWRECYHSATMAPSNASVNTFSSLKVDHKCKESLFYIEKIEDQKCGLPCTWVKKGVFSPKSTSIVSKRLTSVCTKHNNFYAIVVTSKI